jgi:L-lactate dehydrogenase complex protein LldG
MTTARAEILGAIKGALHGASAPAEVKDRAEAPADNAAAEQRLQDRPANLIPARGRLGDKARVDLFIREAERVNATVARVSSIKGVPREVARYLAKNNLPMELKIAPGASEPAIPWTEQTLLSVTEGPADGSESVGVSQSFAGVAETGTLVLLSGPESPTTLNFLPPTHVVILAAGEIAGDYEQVWARLRSENTDETGRFMPRTINWITGPSRTADIEQKLLLGAHGPQRLHIVIVDDEAA